MSASMLVAGSMSYSPKPQSKQSSFVMDWAWGHRFSSSRQSNSRTSMQQIICARQGNMWRL